jgi:hydrogenase maturation protease
MKTLLIGLGNPILGDDGVGWQVADAISNLQCPIPNLEIDRLSLGGLSLMERMIGYEHVILIDSLVTGQFPLGHVTSFTLDQLPDHTGGHTTAAHDTSLLTALRVGKQMGAQLPEPPNIRIIGIETLPNFDFSEELSPSVAAAVPVAAHLILNLLGGNHDFP